MTDRAATPGDSSVPSGAPSPIDSRLRLRAIAGILATAAAYYVATWIAWHLCLPDSKVSLFFPPHAVLVAILLVVPGRHWWAYTLAAALSHFFATQQAGWPPLFALHCEVFDAVQNVLVAAGTRALVKSRFDRLSLREALSFVLVAAIVVPFGTAFWGAALTVFNGFGTNYWVEWRNLGISNAVTAILLIPAFLIGARRLSERRGATPARLLEATLLGMCLLVIGYVVFDRLPAGPDTSPALLYAPVPLFIWAALRFGLGGVSASLLTVASLAITGTMNGRGPFLAQSATENALALQLFFLMAAAPLILLTVAIDDERRSKEALRESEERMSLAVESAQLAIWEWDVAKEDVWATDEARKILGLAPGESVRFSDLSGRVHPDDVAGRARAIRHALETSGTYESEFRIVLPDGSVRWIVGRGRPSPSAKDGSPRILGVSMDVTRQKQAAAEAQSHREELAHLSRAASLGALSSSLAHELGQPLSSILLNAQSGQRFLSAGEPDLEELSAVLAEIVGAGLRAGEIIDRLRVLLRRGAVALQPVNVRESLEELLRLTRNDLLLRGVAVSNLAANGLPPAMTDRVQLQQVLLNLIVNACDAMQPYPAEDRQVTLTTELAQDELRIGVLDRGVGLPEDVGALFEPFHSTKEGGLGMGLSICRMLVSAHGGRMWAERREGRGAAFYVALRPAREQA